MSEAKAAEAQPGSPEYEVAMAAKVDESAANAVAAANDSGLPKEGVQEPAKVTEEPQKEAPEGDAKKAVEAAGIDYAKLQGEYDEKGELSEDSFSALEKAGFPREVVSEFVQGQEARAELRVLQAAEVAGGREQLSAMQEWAKSAYSPKEVEAFNVAVGGSKEDMTKAVGELRTKYEAAYGSAPSLLGGRPSNQAAPGYASKAEMTADMKDPRYAKDSAYRAKVTAKIAATTAF